MWWWDEENFWLREVYLYVQFIEKTPINPEMSSFPCITTKKERKKKTTGY